MRQLWKSAYERLTGPQYSWPLSTSYSHTKSLLPFEYERDVLEKQDLKEKKANVPYKETNEWFCCDKEENGSLPTLVLSFSTETRQPDKLAIRKIIWQAVQSAFAAPLHLLNIMKPCSVPTRLVNIKRIQKLEKTSQDAKWQPMYQTYVLLRPTWRSELKRVSQSISQQTAVQGLHTVSEFLLCFIHKGDYCSWYFWWSGQIFRWRHHIHVVC